MFQLTLLSVFIDEPHYCKIQLIRQNVIF